jgi:hypothetical protein
MTSCFLLRVVFFSYRLMTGLYFPPIWFYTCAYFIPEVVPSALQVWLSEATVKRTERNDRTIDDLYEDEERYDSTSDGSVSNISRVPSQTSELEDNAHLSPSDPRMPPSRQYDEHSALLDFPGSGNLSDEYSFS